MRKQPTRAGRSQDIDTPSSLPTPNVNPAATMPIRICLHDLRCAATRLCGAEPLRLIDQREFVPLGVGRMFEFVGFFRSGYARVRVRS